MKAVVCRNRELRVVERPEPRPGSGQVLVKVLRCGICGSDLHVRDHCDEWGALMTRSNYTALTRSDQEVVFGHEFSAEILEYGPDTRRKLKPGRMIVSPPTVRHRGAIDLIGLSAQTDGAYAERLVVQEDLMMPVPNGLGADLAALTEPMAVGWHAVERGELRQRDTAIVIGCGPVGLSIIAILKARGISRIVASDLSAARRDLATACGAHVVVDPSDASPYAGLREAGYLMDAPQVLELSVGSSEKIRRLPVPWWHAWRLIQKVAGNPRGPVVFECVGAPGVLQQIIDGTPHFTRIVVVGVCMEPDRIEHGMAINKSVDLRYVVGYSPLEFRDTLHAIADGKIDCGPIVTGEVGLHGVDAAFAALASPDRHAKILIDPASAARTIEAASVRN